MHLYGFLKLVFRALDVYHYQDLIKQMEVTSFNLILYIQLKRQIHEIQFIDPRDMYPLNTVLILNRFVQEVTQAGDFWSGPRNWYLLRQGRMCVLKQQEMLKSTHSHTGMWNKCRASNGNISSNLYAMELMNTFLISPL